MNQALSHLSWLIDDPNADVLYFITMQHVLKQIALRMGDDALSLSAGDLQLLREEVVAAIQEMIDYRDAIDEGISVFQITRHL